MCFKPVELRPELLSVCEFPGDINPTGGFFASERQMHIKNTHPNAQINKFLQCSMVHSNTGCFLHRFDTKRIGLKLYYLSYPYIMSAMFNEGCIR